MSERGVDPAVDPAADPAADSGVDPTADPNGTTETGRAGTLRARIVSGLVPFVGLVLLWMLLWGQFTWLSLVTGVLLGVVVSATFYLPAVRLSGHVDPLRGAIFLGRLLIDIVIASLQIALIAIRPGYTPQNAIIAVPLRTRSDLIMTLTSVAIALVPGSIVLDIDRETATLYLHALNVTSPAGVEHLKKEVLATERRLILTAGSVDDRHRLEKFERRNGQRQGQQQVPEKQGEDPS